MGRSGQAGTAPAPLAAWLDFGCDRCTQFSLVASAGFVPVVEQRLPRVA